MAVTNYYTIDGQMLGYKDAGGRKDFLTDALGSVTGEVDQTGTNRTFNGRYKPYGGMLWSSGSRGSFGWVGTWGYKSTGLKGSSHYVRARHYSQTSGIWTTQDPLYPYEMAYGYIRGHVLSGIDPSGSNWDDCPEPNHFREGYEKLKKDLAPFCKYPRLPGTPIYECYKSCGETTPAANAECLCKHATGEYKTSFGCYYGNDESGSCFKGLGGLQGYCMGTFPGGRFTPCRIRICPKTCDAAGLDWDDYRKAIMHEMMHCCGSAHDTPPSRKQFDCIENCLRGVFGWKNKDNGWKGWPKRVKPKDVKCVFK